MSEPSATSSAFQSRLLPGPRASEAAAQAQLERMLDDLGRMYRERNAALLAVERAQRDALLHLAVAAEMRDDDTGVHIVRLGYLAEQLALAIGADPAWARRLRLAAPMHDVGKIGIPDAVLKKPGPLTEDERAIMQRHPRLGAEILGGSRTALHLLSAELALTHHEKWDGSGYPQGLAGEAIPLAGRIVAIVDFFDALTMDRCYRPAFTTERVLQMLVHERGASFDPRLVDSFIANADSMLALRERVNQVQPGFGDLDETDLLAGVLPSDRADA